MAPRRYGLSRAGVNWFNASNVHLVKTNQNSNQMKDHHQPPNKLIMGIQHLIPFVLCLFTASVPGENIEMEPVIQQFVARFAVGQSRGEVVATERHEGALSAIIHAPESADMSPEDAFEVAFMAKDRLHQTTKADSVEVLFSCNRPKLRKYLRDFFVERLKPTEQLTDPKEINRLLAELYSKCTKFATMKKKAEADGWIVTPVNDGLKLKRDLKDGLMILDPLLGVRFSRKSL